MHMISPEASLPEIKLVACGNKNIDKQNFHLE